MPTTDDSGSPPEGTLDRALTLVRFLRRECPWDAKQTPSSLVPHLLEECHEVVDAILADDPPALEGELGDLLLNLAFQIVIGEEEERFTAESVTARLEEKMRRRHPHLYGDGEPESWEALKAKERDGESGVLAGLAGGLDPLTRAFRIQERVSGVGFDWNDPGGAFDKVLEEIEEVREALDGEDRTGERPKGGSTDEEALEEELGDLLFAVVNLARLAGRHPTTALERANRKFRRRFEGVEELASARGLELRGMDLEALDRLWEEVKDGE